MGTYKKFAGGMMAEHIATIASFNDYTNLPVPSFKDVNGNSYSNSYARSNVDSIRSAAAHYNLTPIATADEYANYSYDDYAITAVGTTTFAKARNVYTKKSQLIHTITVENTTESDIVVKCIKFRRSVMVPTGTMVNVLDSAYFLDSNEYITVAPGATETLVIIMNVEAT